MTTTPLTDQQLDAIEQRAAHLHEYVAVDVEGAQSDFDKLTGEDVPALLAEIRRQRAEAHLTAIEQVQQVFAAELSDERALILLDALIVLRSKLPCTCARSQGLHDRQCRRYVPGHELLSPARRLARAREELCRAAAAASGGER